MSLCSVIVMFSGHRVHQINFPRKSQHAWAFGVRYEVGKFYKAAKAQTAQSIPKSSQRVKTSLSPGTLFRHHRTGRLRSRWNVDALAFRESCRVALQGTSNLDVKSIKKHLIWKLQNLWPIQEAFLGGRSRVGRRLDRKSLTRSKKTWRNRTRRRLRFFGWTHFKSVTCSWCRSVDFHFFHAFHGIFLWYFFKVSWSSVCHMSGLNLQETNRILASSPNLSVLDVLSFTADVKAFFLCRIHYL